MTGSFPITLSHLQDRLCIIIGGGEIAQAKVRSLIDAGARIRVIAPEITAQLMEIACQGQIEWQARPYRERDLEGAFLAIAATNDPEINHFIARAAEAQKILINVVDDPDYSNFISPAILRRGDLTIAVSTGALVPALAAHLRARLEREFDDTWAEYVLILSQLRSEIAQQFPDVPMRRRMWARLLDSDLLTYVGQGDEVFKARVTELLS